MLKTRRELTRAVTIELRAIEELLDEAQVRQAQLIAIATQGRRDAKLPLFAGEDALALVADAQVDLLKTRKAIHAAHYAFRDVRDQMGIRSADDFGDHGDTPRDFTDPMGIDARPAIALVQAA